jgi:hypothetical protein
VEQVEAMTEVKPPPVKVARGKAKITNQPGGNEAKAPEVKAPVAKAAAAVSNRAPVMVKYIDVESMETISNPDAATEKMPPPEDATIVLPLYGAKRPGRDDKGRRD